MIIWLKVHNGTNLRQLLDFMNRNQIELALNARIECRNKYIAIRCMVFNDFDFDKLLKFDNIAGYIEEPYSFVEVNNDIIRTKGSPF